MPHAIVSSLYWIGRLSNIGPRSMAVESLIQCLLISIAKFCADLPASIYTGLQLTSAFR